MLLVIVEQFSGVDGELDLSRSRLMGNDCLRFEGKKVEVRLKVFENLLLWAQILIFIFGGGEGFGVITIIWYFLLEVTEGIIWGGEVESVAHPAGISLRGFAILRCSKRVKGGILVDKWSSGSRFELRSGRFKEGFTSYQDHVCDRDCMAH